MKAYLGFFFLLALALPFFGSEYLLSAGVSVILYAALASTWTTFTGPAKYLSLATSAFFGTGVYTVALLYPYLPWLALVVLAYLLSALLALGVGLATLRLQGIYFTVFTYGLAELIRQVVTWVQRNLGGSVGSYIFLDLDPLTLYYTLVGLAFFTLIAGLRFQESRLGLALTATGDDELAARHAGVPIYGLRVGVFALTSGVMGALGAVVAPRWVYIDPSLAFNPNISFLTAVTALLGGLGSPAGAFLAAPPLVLVYDLLSGRFPHHATALMGLGFVLLVYFLPRGLLGLFPTPKTKTPRYTQTARAIPEPKSIRGPLLQAKSLTKSFGGLVAVAQVDLEVRSGEAVGLIGPNGSGKTTLLGLLAGTLKPEGGQVCFLGQEVTGRPPEALARLGLARTFQQVRLFPSLTVYAHVYLPLCLKDPQKAGARAWEVLARVGLAEKAHLFPASLTYLDAKRLELARALALSPRLLLLDEWLAGLNPAELQQAVALLQEVKREGVSLLIVEHLMSAIRALCDRVYVLSFGELIAQGPTEEVLRHPKVVEVYLGVEHA
ncbi:MULTISPECIES: branched-chain amino acid ABC transporter ATP-binding protein/permease [Thermus]|uniref:branched-chain amino acid ABC transporter ATP-binding protein/permease n=1 Tax=Thermus TaxID=270 RepID=UPI001F191E57|nr:MULTISPECIES: ATP-binding cassette domain-containing protein [Thermus]